jgi:hypothetical protein
MNTVYSTIPSTSGRLAGSKYPNKIKKAKKMKLSLRQRFKNWLLRDDHEIEVSRDIVVSDNLSSEGMKFQLYKASGGYVIETRSYDQRKDRSEYHMYIVTDDKNLGNEIGKIITLESLR